MSYGKFVYLPMVLGGLFGCVSCAADVHPANTLNCAAVTGRDWLEKLKNHFGDEICLIGRVSIGPDGVDLLVSPQFGPPPYGNLIRTNVVEVEMLRLGIETGEAVALRGRLLGRDFCNKNSTFEGCDRPWARLNRYYLYIRDKVFIQKAT